MGITLSETQIKEAIVKMNNSEEYLALRKYYAEESFIKILHVSREEKMNVKSEKEEEVSPKEEKTITEETRVEE